MDIIDRSPYDEKHPFLRISIEAVKNTTPEEYKLLSIMLSNKQGWKFNRNDLMARTGFKDKRYRKAVRGLKDKGYLSITLKHENGIATYEYYVTDKTKTLTEEPEDGGSEMVFELSPLLQSDLTSFVSSSPYFSLGGSEIQELINISGKYEHASNEQRGYDIKDISRVIKVALIKSVHKKPNPVKYFSNVIDDWISKQLFTLDDINSNQLSNNGSSIYDALGFHDEEEFLEDDLDNNSYDWNWEKESSVSATHLFSSLFVININSNYI